MKSKIHRATVTGAARLVHPGDRVIVITDAGYDKVEVAGFEPRIVHVDEHNRPTSAPRSLEG